MTERPVQLLSAHDLREVAVIMSRHVMRPATKRQLREAARDFLGFDWSN